MSSCRQILEDRLWLISFVRFIKTASGAAAESKLFLERYIGVENEDG